MKTSSYLNGSYHRPKRRCKTSFSALRSVLYIKDVFDMALSETEVFLHDNGTVYFVKNAGGVERIRVLFSQLRQNESAEETQWPLKPDR